MKLAQETNPVAISGAVGAPSRFNITASKIAFRVLSDGLYNNKIRAIIRELACNAYDAHVAAGKRDIPFELHLPTSFEPMFVIKDFGTGLEYRFGGCEACKGTGREFLTTDPCATCDGTGDYDAVKELYCNYFSSNKSNSNLFIGALGLGSKSPFCYTEGFSIKNIYDGWTRIYSCFLNEEGMPAVLLQEATETPQAEPGVEVSFPVNQKDVWEFENQAAKALEFFDPCPAINVNITIQRAEYAIRGETWGLRKNDKLGGKVRAIQGFVAYQVGEIDTSKLTDDQKELLNLPLDLFFPIGELSVAASRESLSNDKHTVENILKTLVGVKEHLLEDVRQQLSKVKSQWEARVLLYSLSNMKGIGKFVRRAHSMGQFNGMYEGFTISTEDPTINQLDYPHVKIVEYTRDYRNRGKAAKTDLTKELPNPAQMQLETFHRDKYKIGFAVDEGILFVLNDLGFTGEKYIHHLVQNDETYKAGYAYLLSRPGKEVSTDMAMAEAEKILFALGNPPHVFLSQLKDKYKDDISVKVQRKIRDILYFDTYNDISRERGNRCGQDNGEKLAGWKKGWKDGAKKVPADLTEIKYYVPVKKLVPQSGNFECGHDFQVFFRAAQALPEFGLTGKIIFGVPDRDNNIENLDDTWVNVVGYVMSRLIEIMTPEKELQLSLMMKPFCSNNQSVLLKIGENKYCPATSPLQQFCTDYFKAKETEDIVGHRNLATLLRRAEKLDVYKINNVLDFSERWRIVGSMYPLLRQVDSYDFRTVEGLKEAVVDYINMIDERNANLRANNTQEEEDGNEENCETEVSVCD